MRTDVSLSCPIADIYSRLAKPFEGSHPVRVYAQSDWVFGGQPWVMKVAASMFDHWKPKKMNTFLFLRSSKK